MKEKLTKIIQDFLKFYNNEDKSKLLEKSFSDLLLKSHIDKSILIERPNNGVFLDEIFVLNEDKKEYIKKEILNYIDRQRPILVEKEKVISEKFNLFTTELCKIPKSIATSKQKELSSYLLYMGKGLKKAFQSELINNDEYEIFINKYFDEILSKFSNSMYFHSKDYSINGYASLNMLNFFNIYFKGKNVKIDDMIEKYKLEMIKSNNLRKSELLEDSKEDLETEQNRNNFLQDELNKKSNKLSENEDPKPKKPKTKKSTKQVLPEYKDRTTYDSWDDVIITYSDNIDENICYKSTKKNNALDLAPKRKKLLNHILISDQEPQEYYFKHDKTTFIRLIEDLKALFNKTVRPLDWLENQKVYKKKIKSYKRK